MAFRFFIVPVHDDGSAAEELNGFLRGHKVLSVERRWVEQGALSFWSLCVDYLQAGSNAGSSAFRRDAARNRIDYREVLKPDEFILFAKLRDLRKEIAQADGSNRVIRGGSWNNNARNCRSANRNRNEPTNRNNNLGFRVALQAPPRSRTPFLTDPVAVPPRR